MVHALRKMSWNRVGSASSGVLVMVAAEAALFSQPDTEIEQSNVVS
jgi:hypothetical protein